jgi:hypothetical protein
MNKDCSAYKCYDKNKDKNQCRAPECGGDPSSTFAKLLLEARSGVDPSQPRLCVFTLDVPGQPLLLQSVDAGFKDCAQAEPIGYCVFEDLGQVLVGKEKELMDCYNGC